MGGWAGEEEKLEGRRRENRSLWVCERGGGFQGEDLLEEERVCSVHYY